MKISLKSVKSDTIDTNSQFLNASNLSKNLSKQKDKVMNEGSNIAYIENK
jgi:hypothetical protein